VLGSVSGLTVRLNGTHSFYDTDSVSGRTINRAYPKFLRLVNFEVSSSFSLKGGSGAGAANDSLAQSPTPTASEAPGEGEGSDRFDNPEWHPSPAPWEAGISFHYGERRDPNLGVSKNIWSSVNLEVQATKNWKVSYDTRIDLHSRLVVYTNISIYRDMHCWEGRFTWNPVGKSYYLIICIKSPQLRDIKLEKQKGSGGFLGYN